MSLITKEIQKRYEDFFVGTINRTPDICGYYGRGCRKPEANTALCMSCPLADFAGKWGEHEWYNEAVKQITALLPYYGEEYTANYWIDSNTNIFAYIEDNGDEDCWVEIKLEKYEDGEQVEDFDFSTDSLSAYDVRQALKDIAEFLALKEGDKVRFCSLRGMYNGLTGRYNGEVKNIYKGANHRTFCDVSVTENGETIEVTLPTSRVHKIDG